MDSHDIDNASPAPPSLSPLATSPPPLAAEKEFIITLALETLPLLWDKTHSHYVNKYKRNEALNKLLIILKLIKPHATLQDVKNKINTLRSNYRREYKKIISSKRSGAGLDDIYVPKTWTYEYLHFLDKFEKPLNKVHTSGEVEDSQQSQQGQQDTESQQGLTTQSTTSISSVNEVHPPKPSIQKKKGSVDRQNELLERACSYLSDPVYHSRSIANDWAQTIDQLDPTQRLFAKKAINDILFEAQLGNLNRYSVKINEPTYTSLISPAAPYPIYSNTSVILPHAPSPISSDTSITSPPAPSPIYTNTSITSPPAPSPIYTNTSITSPPAPSPIYNTSITSPPAPSPICSNTSISSPPAPSQASAINLNSSVYPFIPVPTSSASQIIISNPNFHALQNPAVQQCPATNTSYSLHIPSPPQNVSYISFTTTSTDSQDTLAHYLLNLKVINRDTPINTFA